MLRLGLSSRRDSKPIPSPCFHTLHLVWKGGWIFGFTSEYASTPILAASRDFHFSTATSSRAIPSNKAQLKNIDFGKQPMLTSPVCQLFKEPDICLIISDDDSNEEEKIKINKGNKNKCSSFYLPEEALGSCKQKNAFRKVLEYCLSPELAESNITTGDKNNQDVG
ncbi:unnamed protein product [Protopolystoma xenopodis]|uniref:Uncharacterized protein n=1 Tax=Protopolystoma xenopodis TaxID=117903 RepID=A0A3S5CQB1_9PLAT|nr:unnamed protein product [Protopolystoma xenopodis]